METPSKWSLSRLAGLASLVVALLAALGGLFDFFHLGGAGWLLTASTFVASITERAQGGKGKLLAENAENRVSPSSGGSGVYGGRSGSYGGPQDGPGGY